MMVFSLCGGWFFSTKKWVLEIEEWNRSRDTGMCTLPETNMFAPENRQSQMQIHLPSINFRGELLFREGKPGCEVGVYNIDNAVSHLKSTVLEILGCSDVEKSSCQ